MRCSVIYRLTENGEKSSVFNTQTIGLLLARYLISDLKLNIEVEDDNETRPLTVQEHREIAEYYLAYKKYRNSVRYRKTQKKFK